MIAAPTVIGPGAKIADSYIGPYTSIGERARVEDTEVERSTISPGASVMHAGGRLVASVVGRDARVFRDFSLPRAVRPRIGDGTEVALCWRRRPELRARRSSAAGKLEQCGLGQLVRPRRRSRALRRGVGLGRLGSGQIAFLLEEDSQV